MLKPNETRACFGHTFMRCAGLALALTLSFAAGAQAHDAPQIQRIIYRDGGRVLLSTNRGLIFGDSEQGPWRFMCNDAIHVRSTEKAPLAYLGDGRLMVVTTAGLQVSGDEGCNWTAAGFGDGLIPAFAVHPDHPDRIYLSTFPIAQATDMNSGRSALRMSEDGGASWTVVRSMADDDFVRSLLIAPSDPDRIYAAGTVYASGARMFYGLRSNDAGQTWEQFEIEVGMDESDFTLLSVSPTDPDSIIGKVAAGTPRAMPERVVISRDGGETWQTATSVMMFRDAAFSADGTVAWVAGGDGLFRSNEQLTSFERVSETTEMTTALEHDGALLAAGWYEGLAAGAHKNGIGRSSDDGASFEPVMSFQDVLEPIACDDDATTPPACAALWRDWEYEVQNMFSAQSLVGTPTAGTGGSGVAGSSAQDAGTVPSMNAGAAAGGASSGDGGDKPQTPAAADDGGGGCSVAQVSETRRSSALAYGSLVLALARLVRRRKPRSVPK